MPGRQGVRMEIADIALLSDQIYHILRHLHIPVRFEGLRDLLYDPLVILVYDHVRMYVDHVPAKVPRPLQSTDFTAPEPADGRQHDGDLQLRASGSFQDLLHALVIRDVDLCPGLGREPDLRQIYVVSPQGFCQEVIALLHSLRADHGPLRRQLPGHGVDDLLDVRRLQIIRCRVHDTREPLPGLQIGDMTADRAGGKCGPAVIQESLQNGLHGRPGGPAVLPLVLIGQSFALPGSRGGDTFGDDFPVGVPSDIHLDAVGVSPFLRLCHGVQFS